MSVLYKFDIELSWKIYNLGFTHSKKMTALGLKRLAIDARAGSLYQVEKKVLFESFEKFQIDSKWPRRSLKLIWKLESINQS